mgnify:CR=1 FL=1
MSGNLVADPEVTQTKSGLALTKFRVAVNDRKKEGNDWVDDPSFYNVVCWDKLASHVAESCYKGTGVIIRGRLKENTWTNTEGETRRNVEIIADDVGVSLKFAIVEKIERMASTGRQQESKPKYEKPEEPF